MSSSTYEFGGAVRLDQKRAVLRKRVRGRAAAAPHSAGVCAIAS